MSLNLIVLEGRLTRDPELTAVNGGQEKCGFTIAVDRYAGKDKDKETDFFTCEVWGQRAAFVSKYFHKGDGINVTGAHTSRTVDKDGQKRTYWTVKCSTVDFPVGGNKGASAGHSEPSAGVPVDAGDVPF